MIPGQCDSFVKLWKRLIPQQDIALTFFLIMAVLDTAISKKKMPAASAGMIKM